MAAPAAQLRLDWIYGYRGHQCRNNVQCLKSGEIVYFIAAAGVVYDPITKTQRHFIEHSDDIICLATHPDLDKVATGEIGSNPVVYIWDPATLSILSVLSGVHSAGITALDFSSSGNLLGSIDLATPSTFCVYDWKKGKLLASHTLQTERVFDVKFKPGDDSRIVTCGVKHINFWQHCGNSLQIRPGKLASKSGEVQSQMCLVFGEEDTCFSGTLSGDIYQWSGGELASIVSSAHIGAVFSMHRSAEGIASAGKDGIIKLWSSNLTLITSIDLSVSRLTPDQLCLRSVFWYQDRIVVGTKTSAILEVDVKDRTRPRLLISGHAEGEMWALATHPKKDVFVTGSDDGTIRTWDAIKHFSTSLSTMSDAVRALAFSPNGAELAAGLKNGDLVLLEFPAMKKIAELIGSGEAIHELKFSNNGEYLAAGYNDGLVLVFSTSKGFTKPIIFREHTEFISHLDWSTDGDHLLTNAGTNQTKVFCVSTGKEVANTEIQPASHTRVIDPTIQGIYPKFMKDVNDVNAIDVDLVSKLAVTGDDYGNVKVFQYPCTAPGSKAKRYIGHSAHVTNVRFNHSKKMVVSIGGADHAIFQWKVYQGMDPGKYHSHTVDSCDEDSDMSDAELDSDLEEETQISYDREKYREDISTKKKKKKGAGISRPAAPDGGLLLDFVFGYRGYDARNNIHFTSQCEVVYHVAALGILYDSENNTQRFYTKHTDDILCLALHPLKDYVATGQVGRDPAIHVWDIQKTTTISILKGQHQRGVCSVDFSSDGKLLASVGLDDNHTIVIWGWRKGEKIASVRGNKSRIFSVKWRTASADSLVSVGVRHINFWTMKGASLTSKRGVFGNAGKSATMLCCTFSKSGDMCYSGAENGLVYQWSGSTLKSTTQAHTGAIHALCALDKGYVSGGKDGTVCLWDESFANCLKKYLLSSYKTDNPMLVLRPVQPVRGIALGQGKIVVGTRMGNIFQLDKAGDVELLVGGHAEGEVWGLAPHPTEQVIATVSDDKTLKVWDVAERKIVLNKDLATPARAVGFSPDGKILAIGYKDGKVDILDTEDYSIAKSLKHRKENISDLAFCPNSKHLAVASHDNFVDVYATSEFKRVCVCKGASSYITHVDWDKSGTLLMLNSGASEVLFYEIPKGQRVPLRKTDIAAQEWTTWTSVLSDQCQGIWPSRADVTDINAAHVSQNGNIIATGDDFGFVKLFDFPALQKNAKSKRYLGHSAHVTNVRWTHADNFLTTTGGGDTAVMLWTHRGFVASTGDSDDSDSEVEEDGYDSDVEFECSIDYNSKTYSNPIRLAGEGLRPDLRDASLAPDSKISRQQTNTCDVVRRKTCQEVNSLKLAHVFGYRGYDARHNIHFLESETEIVYHAAGIGIVTNLETMEQRFYCQHTDDILCLGANRHPKHRNIIATGQLGTTAQVLVWNAVTMETVSILQGFHTRGVCTVNFSSSGKLLVSAGLDDSHSMAIWQWSDGTLLASVENTALRVLHCEFRPDSDSQLVSVGQKHVNFWTLAGTDIISKKVKLPAGLGVKMQTMLSVAFSTGGITYTGAISGDVFVWQEAVLARVINNVHTGPVFSLYTTLKDGLIVSGGKEKTGKCVVKLWDQAMKRSKTFPLEGTGKCVVKALSRVRGSIVLGTSKGDVWTVNERSGHVGVVVQSHGSGEVWGLATHPTQQIAATTASDKTVRLWDVTGAAMEGSVTVKSAGLCADFHPNGSHLAVGCVDGSVLVFSPNLQQVHAIRDTAQQVQVVRFSPDGKYLAVGSDDSSVSLYSVTPVSSSYTRLTVCRGLPGPVLQLDWSHDSKILAVSLSTYDRVYLQCPEGYKTDPVPGTVYHTSTTVLGPNMVGTWPKGSQRFDVNTACVAHGSNVVATGDDNGAVKLFEYPCKVKYAKYKEYYGHSAHVTGVRFTSNDKYLVSTGGEDSCVLVWETDL